MQLKPKHIGLAGIMLLSMVLSTSLSAQQTLQQEVVKLSAKEAVDYALVNRDSVKLAKLDELIQLAKNKEVSGLAMPNISATGQFQDNPTIQKQLIDASNFDPNVEKGTLVPFAFGLKFNAVGEVKLSQTLFDPSVLVALQARQTLEDLSRKGVQKAEIDIKSGVYKAYYNVLSAQKALGIMKGNIVSLEKSLNDMRETYKNGLAEKLDVDRLVVQLTNLRTEERNLRNMEEVGITLLKFQMGMSLKQQIQLTDSLTTAAIKAEAADVSNFDYSQRIEYQLLQTQKKANEYDLKRYKLKGLPSLSLFATGGASRASNKFNYFSSQVWYGYSYYGVNLSIPIFTGFQRKRQVDQAFLAMKKTEVNLERAKDYIDMEQQQSSTTFRNNLATLESQEENMKLAQEVYNTTQIKFNEGVGSSLEMTTAENELLKAQNNYFNALYNAIAAKIDYLKAYGKL